VLHQVFVKLLQVELRSNTAASRYRYGLAKLKERLEPLAKE
jgi:hypothetical protein